MNTDSMAHRAVGLVRRFGVRHLNDLAVDAAGEFPHALRGAMAELGFFGLSIPEAYGGSGLTLGEVCDTLSVLAEHDRAVATTLGLHLGLGTRGTVAFGQPALRDELLPRFASGEAVAAFSATEAGAGSNLRGIETTAVPVDGGFRVTGSKIFVTNGGLCDVITALVSTPGAGGNRQGQSLIAIDRRAPGVSVGREEKKLGLRGSSTTPVHFDDVFVPALRVVGDPGCGVEHVDHILAWGRTVMAAGCVGSARAALALTREHTGRRRQFGGPLIKLSVVRSQVAELMSDVFMMEALVVWVAGSADDATLARRSLSAKVMCSETNWKTCDAALQLHGGMGYLEETRLPLLLRDARITRIFEGANDILRVRVGMAEVAAPSRRPRLPAEVSAIVRERFAAIERYLREYITLRRETLGAKLLARQDMLHQIGNAAIIVDAAYACAVASAANERAAALADFWLMKASDDTITALRAPRPQAAIDAVIGEDEAFA